MKYLFVLIVTMTILISCHPGIYKSETDFANKLAEQGLWKEANFRWQKSISQGKATAATYNNLAVYYEKIGETAKAETAYKKALKLAPQNKFIVSNYDKFKRKGEKVKNEK